MSAQVATTAEYALGLLDSYSVTIIQINRRTGSWIVKSYAECDNVDAATVRIETAIAFYRSRGYAVNYRVTYQHKEIMSGEAK